MEVFKNSKINKTGWLPDSYLIDDKPNINIVVAPTRTRERRSRYDKLVGVGQELLIASVTVRELGTNY